MFYIILEHKQPVYIETAAKETVESILTKTNIPVNDLEKFLSLNFKDGVNHIYELKRLVKDNNAYACFEIGYMEYKGEYVGYPRYNMAYKYFLIASNYNHPRANVLIADMLLKGQIGTKSKDDIKLAENYLEKAISFGSIAALNKLGLLLMNKNKKKAIDLFEKAASYDYIYAYNNLGKIYELKKDYDKAFYYYSKSASKEESWACNKLGEFYRLGLFVKKDMQKAYYYYNLATEVPITLLEYYSKYNLAKYFYLEGNYEVNIEKNEELAISFFDEASENNIIEASIELLKIYIRKYLLDRNNDNLNKISYYKRKIEINDKYNQEIKIKIEEFIDKINEEYLINISNCITGDIDVKE